MQYGQVTVAMGMLIMKFLSPQCLKSLKWVIKETCLHFISFVKGRNNPHPQAFLTKFAKLRTLHLKAFFTFLKKNLLSAKGSSLCLSTFFVSVLVFFWVYSILSPECYWKSEWGWGRKTEKIQVLIHAVYISYARICKHQIWFRNYKRESSFS